MGPVVKHLVPKQTGTSKSLTSWYQSKKGQIICVRQGGCSFTHSVCTPPARAKIKSGGVQRSGAKRRATFFLVMKELKLRKNKFLPGIFF